MPKKKKKKKKVAFSCSYNFLKKLTFLHVVWLFKSTWVENILIYRLRQQSCLCRPDYSRVRRMQKTTKQSLCPSHCNMHWWALQHHQYNGGDSIQNSLCIVCLWNLHACAGLNSFHRARLKQLHTQTQERNCSLCCCVQSKQKHITSCGSNDIHHRLAWRGREISTCQIQGICCLWQVDEFQVTCHQGLRLLIMIFHISIACYH